MAIRFAVAPASATGSSSHLARPDASTHTRCRSRGARSPWALAAHSPATSSSHHRTSAQSRRARDASDSGTPSTASKASQASWSSRCPASHRNRVLRLSALRAGSTGGVPGSQNRIQTGRRRIGSNPQRHLSPSPCTVPASTSYGPARPAVFCWDAAGDKTRPARAACSRRSITRVPVARSCRAAKPLRRRAVTNRATSNDQANAWTARNARGPRRNVSSSDGSQLATCRIATNHPPNSAARPNSRPGSARGASAPLTARRQSRLPTLAPQNCSNVPKYTKMIRNVVKLHLTWLHVLLSRKSRDARAVSTRMTAAKTIARSIAPATNRRPRGAGTTAPDAYGSSAAASSR